ncbi:HlyD family efflux transporter periplasmic adaptor subunit [Hymenobacter cellulosilyticus]|uniref:HlyD family secretion protein n=1 Tax=Hymenobacter cellulosilyticus TaxID=2932248 RepID=A0A8T9Q7R0_9BACT|nr:HlyD family efflux transporter periplasmic adaptor subunit [Hymenobacter cellulosilyticus]UOQ73175.1 HlyD family secretion protein [Hymenobacter cellulosilyticus]
MPTQFTDRSDGIQEIIGTSPSWLLRAGAGYLFGLLLLVLVLSGAVRYPDVLPASIVVTSEVAPFTAVTRVNGPLQLLVREGQRVQPNQPLGYVESAASYGQVQALKKRLAEAPATAGIWTRFDQFKQLGELQSAYETFRKATADYQHFEQLDEYSQQVRSLSYEVAAYEALNRNLAGQKELQTQELALASKRYAIDDRLLTSKVIAETDLEASRRTLLQQKKSVASSQANIIANTITASELRRRMGELRLQRDERQQQLLLTQEQTARSLRNAIAQWEADHVLLTKQAGTVTLLKEWVVGQFVPAATPVLSVLIRSTAMTGRLRLPVQGSGKVKAGQRVNIMLDNYPAEQYGMLEGLVARVAPLPHGNSYDVIVKLPSQLVTTYRKPIAFKQQLQGRPKSLPRIYLYYSAYSINSGAVAVSRKAVLLYLHQGQKLCVFRS